MIKRFCDLCSREMTADDAQRLSVTQGPVTLDVVVRDGSGDACHACIRATVGTKP